MNDDYDDVSVLNATSSLSKNVTKISSVNVKFETMKAVDMYIESDVETATWNGMAPLKETTWSALNDVQHKIVKRVNS